MQAFARYGPISGLVILFCLVLLLIRLDSPTSASADPKPKPKFTDIERFQCVDEVGPAETGLDNPFTPAIYRTVINVYNPQGFAVEFTKKAVVARSQRSPRGTISLQQVDTLQPGEAVGIDCVDIQTLLGGMQPVGNGVVVIQASDDLKVIPAYTQLVPPLTPPT